MTSVAVVGLGEMGARFAKRFLDEAHEVIVWNRSPGRASSLTDRGALLAKSPADAARLAEVVVTMVSDPAALQAVTEGTAGLLAGVDRSTTLIDMSTVGPAAVSRLASLLPDGVGLLDAPVLGSLSEAESGSLSIFVGGPPPLVDRWSPLLSTLGSPIRVGPLGAGATAKLVANLTLFGNLAVFGEALALARGLGLSDDAAFEVLARTPSAAQAERRRSSVESGDYPVRFPLRLARKDADLIANVAAEVGLDLRLAAAARAWLTQAADEGWGDEDYSTALKMVLGDRRRK
ncbi:MAG: NAD(P)-dependent oxidoreductase [Actinomycetota bacterium]